MQKEKNNNLANDGVVVNNKGSQSVSSYELTCLSDVETKEVEWLINGIIPKNSVTALVGDGGCGKSSICCQIAASVSNGQPYLINPNSINSVANDANRVIYFTGEDTFSHTLKKRILSYGANEDNIFVMDVTIDDVSKVRFDSDDLKEVIRVYSPSLVILDPIQTFVPSNINMASRNAMRQYMHALVSITSELNCTILLVVHTNKRDGVAGRTRMSDTSDIWDICRSVMMLGETNQDGIKYLSHEKSNFGPLSDTILYEIEDGQIKYKGTSQMKDRDYVVAKPRKRTMSIEQEETQNFILTFLSDCLEKQICEVDKAALQYGCSKNAIQKAKKELVNKGKIIRSNTGVAKSKRFYLKLANDVEEE